MRFMTQPEIEMQNEQLQFRQAFAQICESKGWTIDEVYYSDKHLYANRNGREFAWHGEGDKPDWVVKHLAQYGTLDGARVLPVIRVSVRAE